LTGGRQLKPASFECTVVLTRTITRAEDIIENGPFR
jgi:hypothetical protein